MKLVYRIYIEPVHIPEDEYNLQWDGFVAQTPDFPNVRKYADSCKQARDYMIDAIDRLKGWPRP